MSALPISAYFIARAMLHVGFLLAFGMVVVGIILGWFWFAMRSR